MFYNIYKNYHEFLKCSKKGSWTDLEQLKDLQIN